jgi:polyisoprenoid-binding protein YceI
MKTVFTIIGVLVVAFLVIFLVSSRSVDAPTNTATSSSATSTAEMSELEDGEYEIDSSESTIRWSAEKPLVSSYEDSGVVPVASGTVVVSAGAITSSSIILDVASIEATKTANTSLGLDRLTGNLRSDAFFDVKIYPEGSLIITAVDPVASTTADSDYEVTGELTLKDKTNEITFPATIGMSDGDLIIRGETVINRADYNIRYGSDTFFDNLGDGVIADEVAVSFDLTAQAN